MPDNLKDYTVQGPDGHSYTVTAAPDATDDELIGFVQNQMSQPSPEAAPTPSVSVGKGQSEVPVAPTPNDEQTMIVQGPAHDDFKFKPEVQAELDSAMLNPKLTPKDVNALVNQRMIEAGQPPLGLTPGYEQQIAAYRQGVAEGKVTPKSVGYHELKLPVPTTPTVSSDKNVMGGMQGQIINWLTRGFQEAAQSPDTFGGLAARLYGRAEYGDWAKTLLKKQYPQLTDDQATELSNQWVSQIQESTANANAQATANDPLVPHLIGGMGGSAGPEYALAPELGAGIMGRAAGTAAVTAGANAAYQGASVEQGAQEHFDPAAVAEAGAFGGAFHLGMEGFHSMLPSSARPRVDESTGEPVAPQGINVPTSRKNTKAYRDQLASASQDIADHVNNTVSGWKNAPEFLVHDSFKNLDGVEDTAIGAHTPDGKVILNSEAIMNAAKKAKVAPEDVVNAAVYHEALGHHGLSQMFGDRLDSVLSDFYQNGTKEFTNAVDTWMEKNPDGYANQPDRLERATEEVMAKWSEKGQLPVTLSDRLSNLVKGVGRKMGLDLKYSTREVKTILGMAHDAVVSGKGRDVSSNGFKYMNVGEKANLPIHQEADRIRAQIYDAQRSMTPEEIYQKFGWWKDRDGKWRTRLADHESSLYEMPNGKLSIDNLPDKNSGKAFLLEDVLHHPELYKAYPWLKDVPVAREDNPDFLASYSPSHKTILVNSDAIRLAKEDPHSILLHEIQHAIQHHEDFAGGGNSNSALAKTLKHSEIIPAAKKLIKEHETAIERIRDTHSNFEEALNNPNVKRGSPLSRQFIDRMHELVAEELHHEDAISSIQDAIDHKHITELHDRLLNSEKIKREAYEWLMGEIEARETEALKDVPPEQLKKIGPVGTVESRDPDYMRITREQTSVSASEPTSSVKYMQDYNPEEESAVESAKDIISGALDNYQPRYSSWVEGKRAARDRGLTAKQIRSAKTIGELDKKLFQYDEALFKTNNQMAALLEKRDRGEWTPADKARFLEVSYTFNEAASRVFNDHAEVARALNALKVVYFSRNKLSQLREVLGEAHNSGISAFADEDTFDRFADQMKYLLASNNPEGTGVALRAIVKPYWWEYALSFRHSMMLSGLGTHAKNAKDNALMVARELEESVVAVPGFVIRKGMRAMGADVQEGVSPQEVAGRLYGILRATLDWNTYKNSMDAFMRGHPNRALNPKIEIADARIPVISKVGDALYAADTLFRAIHMNANLYALGVRRAREEGFTGMAAFEEGSNYAASPSEKMLKDARNLTDLALLLDTPSGYSAKLEASKSIRPNMKPGEQAVAFLTNIAFPFFRVTDRLLFQKLRRSPLAFLDKNTRADIAAGGPKMDIALSRILMGSALIAYYWHVAGQGKETGNAPTDPKKLAALQAGGYQKNSVVGDGKYTDATALNLSFDPRDTQNSVAANVASLREAWDKALRNGTSTETEKQKIADGIGMATLSLGSILSSSSFANNLQTYTEPFTQNDDATAKTAGATLTTNLLGQWLPAAMRQYNQEVADPVRRDTTGDKGFLDRVGGGLQANIPANSIGVPSSDQLPAKHDVYGDEMQQGKTLLGMSNYQTVKTDAVAKALQQLERTTDKPVVTGAPNSFELKGVKEGVFNPKYVTSTDDDSVKLTATGHQEWQRIQGHYIRLGMQKILQTDGWKRANDKQRVLVVKQLKTEAAQAAKEHMVPLLGLQARDGYEDNSNDETQ